MLEGAGGRRTLAEGEVLSRAGEVAQRPIRVIGQCRFWGETNLLTGQPAYLTTVAAVARLQGDNT